MIKKIHACNKINFSSNINEVIRTVLNFLLFFMIRSHKRKKALKSLKALKELKAQKQSQVKAQNTKKRISTFFHLRCFLYVFFYFCLL